jgi:hypothetical protein
MLANHDRGMGNFLQSPVRPVSSRPESAMPASDSTALPPIFALGEQVAERYRVEQLLGHGGMGECTRSGMTSSRFPWRSRPSDSKRT